MCSRIIYPSLCSFRFIYKHNRVVLIRDFLFRCPLTFFEKKIKNLCPIRASYGNSFIRLRRGKVSSLEINLIFLMFQMDCNSHILVYTDIRTIIRIRRWYDFQRRNTVS